MKIFKSILAITLSTLILISCGGEKSKTIEYIENIHIEAPQNTVIHISANGAPFPNQTNLTHEDYFQLAFNADPNKDDTDGDGLSDDFEISGYPHLKPDLIDTDGDGINDADGDVDLDGLTNKQEFELNTHPLLADTDRDNLTDFEEVNIYHTNPLVSDTDGDGMPDGREITNSTDPLIPDSDTLITSISKSELMMDGSLLSVGVKITGIGDLASNVQVQGWSDSKLPFQVGQSYDISIDDLSFESAEIELPFDPNSDRLQGVDLTDLRIYTIDPETSYFDELETTLDLSKNTLSAITTHFSPYLIGSHTDFRDFDLSLSQSCIPIDDPNSLPVDVVLVIDSSGSMKTNDPQDLRITAAQNFVEAMKDIDRAAIVDFDSSATVLSGLTANIDGLKNVLNSIDSSGNTNISEGIGSALSILSHSEDSDQKMKVIILLTDGKGTYSDDLSIEAKNKGIRIFTIGLTGSVDEALLKSIASTTHGVYEQIQNANSLVDVFGRFSHVFGDTGVDTDEDGLTDCQETQGIFVTNNGDTPLSTRKLVFSDPTKFDTDGDGFSDSSEIGKVVESRSFFDANSIIFVSSAYSYPDSNDSDGDGITDPDEDRLGTDPLKSDTDSDGLSDYDELVEYFTNPTDANSDGDSENDGVEVQKGRDPLDFDYITGFNVHSFTKGFSKAWEFNTEAAYGLLCGDVICELETVPELLGAITGGFIPIVPDIRDVTAGLLKDDLEATLLAAIGFIPLAGDTAKGLKLAINFIIKNPHHRITVMKGLEKLGDKGKKIASLLPKLTRTAVWSKKPFVRGKEIEILVVAKHPSIFKGQILLGNFPGIDVFDAGRAISIKSMDLDAVTYLNPSQFKSKIKLYLKQLNGFPKDGLARGISQTTGEILRIKSSNVTSKELALVIPRKLSKEYEEIIKNLGDNFNKIDITIIIEG